jgi:cation:H+ antiporter
VPAAAAAVIAIAGTRLARVADQLADLTGMGEALFGALFLGAATSLPGVVTTVVAALEGHTDLAISSAATASTCCFWSPPTWPS